MPKHSTRPSSSDVRLLESPPPTLHALLTGVPFPCLSLYPTSWGVQSPSGRPQLPTPRALRAWEQPQVPPCSICPDVKEDLEPAWSIPAPAPSLYLDPLQLPISPRSPEHLPPFTQEPGNRSRTEGTATEEQKEPPSRRLPGRKWRRRRKAERKWRLQREPARGLLTSKTAQPAFCT